MSWACPVAAGSNHSHSTFLFQLCPCFGHWFSQLQNPASAPLDLNPALSPVVFASQISPVGSAFDYQTLPSEEVLCTPVLTIGARGRAGREQRRQVLPWTVSSKGRSFSDLVTYMKNGKSRCLFPPLPIRMEGQGCASTWSPVLLWPASFSDRETQTFPPSCTCSQKGKERVRGHSGCCGYRTEPWCLPLPPRESTTLRGALTPACILINIIPPSINSKSACFTPGEKNNPRLVSPASPGAAEGLNTPWLSATSFSLGAVDRVWCSLPWRWLWHQKVAARERGRMGWAG